MNFHKHNSRCTKAIKIKISICQTTTQIVHYHTNTLSRLFIGRYLGISVSQVVMPKVSLGKCCRRETAGARRNKLLLCLMIHAKG